MNQHVTITPNLFKYICENFFSAANKKSYVSEIIDIIDQNSLCFDDKNLLANQLLEIFEKSTKQLQNEFKDVWIKWIQNYALNNQYKCEKYNHLLPIYISKSTQDRILITNDDYEQYNLQSKIESLDVEVHNLKSVFNYENNQQLINVPSSIKLVDGKNYSLVKILRPLLSKSNKIIIRDPYIYNYKARKNFEKLFSFLNNKQRVIVESSPYEIYTKNNKVRVRDVNEFYKLIESLKEREFKIEINTERFKNNKNYIGHIERYIFTDRFRIYLPGGLDFINNNGLYKSKVNYGESYDIMRIEFNDN